MASSRRSSSRPRSRGEVERHALLVGVQAGEDPGLLPPVRLREAQAGEQARAVGPGRRLDVQHLGAEHRQHVRAQRPGPERGEVEHPQALRTAASRRPRLPGGAAAGDARRRARRAAARARVAEQRRVEPVGPVGLVEAVARVRDDRAAGQEVVGRRDRRAVADRARAGCGTRRPARGPRRSCARPSTRRSPARRWARLAKSLRSSIHSGWLDHHAEVEPLLAGADADADEAVARRLHAGRDDATARCGTAGPPCRRRSPGSR